MPPTTRAQARAAALQGAQIPAPVAVPVPVPAPAPVVANRLTLQQIGTQRSDGSFITAQDYWRDQARASFIANRDNPVQRNIRNMQQQFAQFMRRQRETTPAALRSARHILDQNINSLYLMDVQFAQYLSAEQLSYITRNSSISNNYYLRRLELSYTIPFTEKFNNMIDDVLINMPNGMSGANAPSYRYDVEYYNTIKNIYDSINDKNSIASANDFFTVNNKGKNGDFQILKDRKRTIDIIVTEIEHDISNEKMRLTTILRRIDEILPTLTDQDLITTFNANRDRMSTRFTSLSNIRKNTLDELFSSQLYDIKRKNLILVLKSLSVLCKTFMLLMIKIHNGDDMVDIINQMYTAVGRFTAVIENDMHIDNNTAINAIIAQQDTLYADVRASLTPDIIRNYITSAAATRSATRRVREQFISALINPEAMARRSRTEQVVRRGRDTIAQQFPVAPVVVPAAPVAPVVVPAPPAPVPVAPVVVPAVVPAPPVAPVVVPAPPTPVPVATGRQTAAMRRAQTALTRRAQAAAASAVSRQSAFIFNPNMIAETSILDAEFQGLVADISDTSYARFIEELRKNFKFYNKDFSDDENKKLFYNLLKTTFSIRFNKDEPCPVVNDTIPNCVGYSIASLFGRYIKFDKDMKFNDLPKYFVANFNFVRNPDNTMNFTRQLGIDVGGLRRDFITSLTAELFNSENGIFMTRDGSKKYFLNPKFKFDENFTAIVDNICSSRSYDMKDFYTFIAQLVSFILVNDCGVEHNLSSYLTAAFSKTDFRDDEYIYYMLNDFPAYTRTMLELMKKPDDIEYVGFEFNDHYNLKPTDQGLDITITKDNILEFLTLTAKHMMTKSILRKDIEIKAGENYDEITQHNENINKYFIEGIPSDIRAVLSEIPLNVINSFIVKPAISHEIVDKLSDNFFKTMRQIKKTPELTRMSNLFNQYVLTQRPQQSDAEFFDFIDKLLRFWSGSAFYKNKEKYKIQINRNLSDAHLPQSHTCFFTIDIPLYTGATDDAIGNKLYNKIEMAISNVEKGIGFAGGSKPVKKNGRKLLKRYS